MVEEGFFIRKVVDDSHGFRDVDVQLKVGRIASTLIGGVFALSVIFSGIFVTEEGYRTVIRTAAEVTGSKGPGLNFKWPLIQTGQDIEIRPRKYELVLAASTTGKNEKGEIELQMPSTVTITGNWNVDPEQVEHIVKTYGSIAQFEDRILDARVREITLAEFPQHTIEQVMTDRTSLSHNIATKLKDELQRFPAEMTDVMVAEVDWHPKIKEAILKKQEEKLLKEQEQHVLDRQNLQAQQSVNTAKAKAESIERVATAEAEAIRLRGEAEASAIRAKGEALRNNPGLVSLIHEEKWDGKLPVYMMGATPDILMQVPAP